MRRPWLVAANPSLAALPAIATSLFAEATAISAVFNSASNDLLFARLSSAMFAILRFTGPEGHVDLKWEFTRP